MVRVIRGEEQQETALLDTAERQRAANRHVFRAFANFSPTPKPPLPALSLLRVHQLLTLHRFSSRRAIQRLTDDILLALPPSSQYGLGAGS